MEAGLRGRAQAVFAEYGWDPDLMAAALVQTRDKLEAERELHLRRLYEERQASAHVVRLAAELAAERAKVASVWDEGCTYAWVELNGYEPTFIVDPNPYREVS